MSFFLDILIILSTVPKVLFAKVPCKQMPKKAGTQHLCRKIIS